MKDHLKIKCVFVNVWLKVTGSFCFFLTFYVLNGGLYLSYIRNPNISNQPLSAIQVAIIKIQTFYATVRKYFLSFLSILKVAITQDPSKAY